MDYWVWIVTVLLVLVGMYFVVRNASSTKQRIQDAAVVSPHGMGVAISVGEGDHEPLPATNDKVELVVIKQSPRKYKCGHEGPSVFKFNTWGESSVEIEQKDLCPECFKAQIISLFIRCGKCGLPIFPGEGVALYSAQSPGLLKGVGYATNGSVLGCLRMQCCPSGGFFAGHWTEQGFRPMYAEGMTVAEHVYSTAQPASNSNV